ncbi:MAG: RDD family protein [Ginsengibacter sp.]
MPPVRISTVFNIDLEFETAPVFKRILAYLCDLTLLIIYFFIAKNFLYRNLLNDPNETYQSMMGLHILLISIPMLLYSLLAENFLNGQTIGKKLLKIRVLSLEGGQPTTSQYIIRWMMKVFEWPFLFGTVLYRSELLSSYILTTCFLGVVVVIIISATKLNQRLGDLAANTVVVNAISPFSVNDTIFINVNNPNYKVMFPEVLRLSDRDISTIKNVLDEFYSNHSTDTIPRLSNKVKEVLNIQTDLFPTDFLEKLLKDYNYLASK